MLVAGDVLVLAKSRPQTLKGAGNGRQLERFSAAFPFVQAGGKSSRRDFVKEVDCYLGPGWEGWSQIGRVPRDTLLIPFLMAVEQRSEGSVPDKFKRLFI